MENIVKQAEQELNADLEEEAKKIVKELLGMKQSLQHGVDELQVALQEFTDTNTPAELQKLVNDYDILLAVIDGYDITIVVDHVFD